MKKVYNVPEMTELGEVMQLTQGNNFKFRIWIRSRWRGGQDRKAYRMRDCLATSG